MNFSFLERINSKQYFAFLLVFLAVAFNIVNLLPEATIAAPPLNDEVLHTVATKGMIEAFKLGFDPTDFWLPQVAFGYPFFLHYPFLPHAAAAISSLLTGIDVARVFDLIRYLLLALFPLSVFVAMRRFGLNNLAASLGALSSSLLSTNGLLGFDYGSYVFSGIGLYGQMWAMFFLPLAFVESYRYISRIERNPFLAVLFTTIVTLSNPFCALVLFVSLLLTIFVVSLKNVAARLYRGFKFLGLVFLVNAFFLVPAFLSRGYLNRTVWFQNFRYDSYGIGGVLKNFVTGNIFDYGRWPVLTLFFVIGLLILIFNFKDVRYRIIGSLALLWFVLYFGRSLWGWFLNLFPFGGDIQLDRLISGVHLFAIFVIGAGLALMWQFLSERKIKLNLFIKWAAFALFVVLFVPVLSERISFYENNTKLRSETHDAFQKFSPDLSAIKNYLESQPPGRIYAGLPATWGNTYYYKIGAVPIYALLTQSGFDTLGYLYHFFSLPADSSYLFNDGRPAEYDLFNVRYVLLHKTWTPAPFYSFLKDFGDYRLYRVQTSGYFDVVGLENGSVGNRGDVFSQTKDWLAGPGPEEKIYQPFLGNGLADFLSSTTSIAKPSTVEISNESVGINHYEADLKTSGSGILVLKVSFHPGWQATIDGKNVTVGAVLPGFVGLAVPSGQHKVSLTYKASALRWPLIFLGLATLILLGFGWARNVPQPHSKDKG